MSCMTVFHNGKRYRAETNLSRGSMMVVCKCSGRYVYARGDLAHKLQNALSDGWGKFGMDADADDVWQWIWLNCGFHRVAEAAQ